MTAQPLLVPFRALRPRPDRAADVAAPPYDVMTSEEARDLAAGRPWSFLHVSRPEIDLPAGADPHAPEAYATAARSMRRMIDAGVLRRDALARYYAYRITKDDHVQTGVAAAASTAAYEGGRIRRHELTRPEKEIDRARQIEAVGAHTGPVLVTYRRDATVAAAVADAASGTPVADASVDGARHQVWIIEEDDAIEALTQAFDGMSAIYVADGHHRAGAAVRVAKGRRASASAPSGNAADHRFLVVAFPDHEVRILDYNRVVKDLRGLSPDAFLAEVHVRFEIAPSDSPVRPRRPGEFGMVLGDRWYRLTLRHPASRDAGAVQRLDIHLLSDRLLRPVLGIDDPRTDPRIDFVGGGRGLETLQRMANSGLWAVGFALYPTALADVIAVADAGEVMPPKSTWFDPKLADGLVSLPLE